MEGQHAAEWDTTVQLQGGRTAQRRFDRRAGVRVVDRHFLSVPFSNQRGYVKLRFD